MAAQTDAIWSEDARTGNRHAKLYIRAYRHLRDMGDAGTEALACLYGHERPDVRVAAAAYLLKHKTEESLALLGEAARHPGLIGFEAGEAIKRWEEGAWHLDD